MALNLDEVDKGILDVLQKNARNATAAEMAEKVGVSASTVRNRIERMEADGVIRGYHLDLDYERAGFHLHGIIECHANPGDRTDVAQQARGLPGVVQVRELLTSYENIHIEAVAVTSDAADELIVGLADLGLEIVNADIVTNEHVQPFDRFGSDVVKE